MPSKTIINCGTSHVTGTVFSEKGDVLFLEQYFSEVLTYDYSDDNLWEVEVGRAMQSVAAHIKPKGEVVIVAPGQHLVTKESRIPAVTDESRRREIYAVEAAAQFQNVAPLSELVWDAQSVNKDDIEEELIFFAMKLDSANHLVELAKLAGFNPTIIQPNTILDIQCYRYWKGCHEAGDETALILNIGAKVSNLTYATPTGYSVSSFGVGGNFITQAIAEARGISFEKAEQVKMNVFEEYENTGGFPSGDIGKIVADACDRFARRLSKEITLRLVALRKRGGKPSRIVMLGRAHLAPGFKQTIENLQKLRCETLPILDCVLVSSFVPVGELKTSTPQILEAVGAAADLVVPGIPAINLFPQELKEIAAFKRRLPWYVLGGLCVAAAPWFAYIKSEEFVDVAKKDLGEQSRAMIDLNERKKTVEDLSREIERCRQYVETTDTILFNRYNWNAVIGELQTTLLELQSFTTRGDDGEPVPAADRNIWIESLNVKRSFAPAQEATEDKEAVPAKIDCDLIVTFRLLLPEIDADVPVHDSKIFDARLKEIRTALKKNMTHAIAGSITDTAKLTPANLPTITFTIRLKDKEEL